MDNEGNSGNVSPSTEEDSPDMVRVRNAYKAYGPSTRVLRGVDLTVKQGSIYAFLGPSGAGKTTLLGCLVGKKHLDHGEIYLGIKYYNEFGYMPQEVALLKDLSIQETMIYYGRVFSMTDEEIKKRGNELLQLFDMPPASRQISTLSGGQQRRASLCITLLHNPKLLILDEPSVGVDPLLREKIWNFLISSTKNGETTILLTTHYIEEARLANRVGMLREGVILVEGNPQAILAEHRCSRLEDVFLQLSEKQELNAKTEDEKLPHLQEILIKKSKSPVKRKDWFSVNRLYAHITKNAFYLKRNYMIVGFLFLLPVVQCVLFNYTVGQDPKGLSIGIINDELVDGKANCRSNFNCSWSYPVSCYLIDQLGKTTLNPVIYNDTKTANIDAIKGHIWGYLHISQNYSASLGRRLQKNLKTSDYDTESSTVNVWLDMSNQYITNFLIRDLYTSYEKYLGRIYKECNWKVEAARIPVAFQKPVYGSNEPKFTESAVPCVILMFSFYLPLMMIVAALLSEKRDGLLERSYVSGVTILEMIIGHACLCLIILIFQIWVMFYVVFYVFQHVLVGSLFLAFCLCLIVGISGMCFGFLLSIICDHDYTATFAGLGSFLALVFTTGMVWPREGMHYILYSASWLFPLTVSTDTFRAISMKAWDSTETLVYEGFLVSLAWAVIFIILTWSIGKLKKVYMNFGS